jgi:hypothetical protein
MAQINDLPPELHHLIADALPAPARAHLSRVSRHFHTVANDDRGWESLYRRDAPAEAHALALQEAGPWKARYAKIADALRHPYLTPPDVARPGDVVTVRDLETEDGCRENVPCRVVRGPRHRELLVVPLDTPNAAPVAAPARMCCNGLPPRLAAAPLACIEAPETLAPGAMAKIRGDLPFRTMITTGLRPGDEVRVHGLGLGFSGNGYALVEDPGDPLTASDWVAMAAAKVRKAEKPSLPRRYRRALEKVWRPIAALFSDPA